MEEKKQMKFNLFATIFSKNFFAVMIGMMVFGIMDNGIMVLAGSAIDSWLSDMFGFSTMFAAGVGNTIIYIVSLIYFSFFLYKLIPFNKYNTINLQRAI